MNNIIIDYHGYTVEDALINLEHILFQNRNKKNDFIEIITGRGKIRKAMIKYLTDNDIFWRLKLGNDGIILIELPLQYNDTI